MNRPVNYFFKITLIAIFFFGTSLFAQNKYKTHKVKQGETVTSIAKNYDISVETIYALNPDAKEGINKNNILIIPLDGEVVTTFEVTDFKRHRVKRKETLFSISQKYVVTIDDIKRYNKRLYSEQLKKGDKIMIPIGIKAANNNNTGAVSENTTNTAETNKATHLVLAKETRYGIARKYGISIAELEALNPNMGDTLQMGAKLFVPNKSVMETATIEDELYQFYEVQQAEGFFRLKVKFGLTKEEIIALNPYASEGLKNGMILKLPKQVSEENTTNTNKINLEYFISDTSPKNLVVMLPFGLQKVSDSTKVNEELLKDSNSRTMRISLDFYSGVLMAAEFAKDKGISVNLDIVDTQGSLSKVSQLISQRNFKNIDAVIGPLLRKNVTKTVAILDRYDTPVFSPLSKRKSEIQSRNFFQTIPSKEILESKMVAFLEANGTDKNIIIIADVKHASQKARLLAIFPNAKIIKPREGDFIHVVDIQKNIDRMYENWVLLISENPSIVSNAIGLLNGLPEDNNVRLFTLDNNAAFDFEDVQNLHLANLNFTFPSVKKDYDYNNPNAFVTSYKNKYGVLPNRYAVRGFDVTYDILLRLAMADDMYDAVKLEGETEYIENKFFYVRSGRGFINNATYIIKFNEKLELEVVE